MFKLYVTYGYNTNLQNCFSVVESENMIHARRIVNSVCGSNYAFSYTEQEFSGQTESFT